MHLIHSAALAAVALFATGCASIVTGHNQPVPASTFAQP